MKSVLVLLAVFLVIANHSTLLTAADSVEVTVAAPVTVVERAGITGAGWATVVGAGSKGSISLVYPNHPDDFGGSSGTGFSRSRNGGATWSQEADNGPIPQMVDLWQDRMSDGTLIALGIRRLPDPKLRGYADSSGTPGDAYALGVSRDDGNTWKIENALLECPAEVGVIARPLPHVFEDRQGAWLMPAYAWSKTGNRSLLLQSNDQGRRWSVRSTIMNVADVREIGVPVTTPWLETAVARTSDGSLLAVMRTGSSEQAALVTARSADDGRTWNAPEKLQAGPERRIVAGKLPNLVLMPSGALVLQTAHTKIGCVLHISSDGTGRDWSDAHIVTKVSGGNTSLVALDATTLLVFTPSSKRISCWKVTLSAAKDAKP